MKRYFTGIFKATIRYGIGTVYRYPTLCSNNRIALFDN